LLHEVYIRAGELANVAQEQLSSPLGQVRVATEADAPAILRLLKTAPYSHIHADWNMPVDWLGTPGFIVQQDVQRAPSRRPSLVTQLLGPQRGLKACLAVAADPPPAAWVRVASVSGDISRAEDALASMLARAVEYLKDLSVNQLGWLAANGWPEKWLTDLGFEQVNQIETYLKEDLEMPGLAADNRLTIRPATPEVMTKLAEIEAAAFLPIWRHSVDTLSLALYQSSGFDVALLDDKIVGFQLSTVSGDVAHLVRLTVDPVAQGRGIGSALLARAVERYRGEGVRRISLNTQVDNLASQVLYRKFGFRATGQRTALWLMSI
jgi:ribosomal protein S18 acetylase RimI-like enzyme